MPKKKKAGGRVSIQEAEESRRRKVTRGKDNGYLREK